VPKSEKKRALMATPEMLNVVLGNKERPQAMGHFDDVVSQVFTASK
jgi:hypothetical protein